MPYTHKRSYKKNFLAYNWDGAAWNGKSKWDGPCKWRLLPAASPLPARNDSRMTGLRFHKSCWSTKSKYHVEKESFRAKPILVSDGLAPIICARYPKNQLISFFAPIRSWALEGARLWNLLKNKVELRQNKYWTEKMQPAHFCSCRDLPLVFPWRYKGAGKQREDGKEDPESALFRCSPGSSDP